MTGLQWWGLALALIGLLTTVLAAAAEGVMSSAGGPRSRSDALSRLLEEPERTWFTVWTLGVFGPAAFAIGILAAAASLPVATAGVPVLVALLAAVLLIVLRVAALSWGSGGSESTARLLAVPLDVGARLVWPLRTALRRVRLPNGPTWIPSRLRDEALRMLVQSDQESEPIEEDEIEMIAGIIELGDTRVREVMVPRIDMVAIPLDATLDEALDTIIGAGHSRIPVYRESIDDIAGLLYAKDLLRPFREHEFHPEMPSLLRDAYFVPQSKPVDELLQELQTRKTHMAIVVDEYGGTAGLVTIEDLLEEIVGEIQDEYDQEEPRLEQVGEDEVVCNAGVDIDDINRLMGIHLPTERVDTLAGLVFTELGKVPEPGERAQFEDAEIEVLELDGRRIHRVRVLRRATEPAEATEGVGPGAEPAPGP